MSEGGQPTEPSPGPALQAGSTWWQDPAGNWHEHRTAAADPRGVGPISGGQCPTCGRFWGLGNVCHSCGQVEGLPGGVRMSSSGLRLGAFALEYVLATVTLGIGWLIWALIIFGRGQTPAKQLLGMRTVTWSTRKRAGWWRMFLREMIVEPVITFLAFITLIGVILLFWLLWDDKNQELWDKVVDTIVVNDRDKLL